MGTQLCLEFPGADPSALPLLLEWKKGHSPNCREWRGDQRIPNDLAPPLHLHFWRYLLPILEPARNGFLAFPATGLGSSFFISAKSFNTCTSAF